MTRRDHVIAITCYAILSAAVLVFGFCVAIFRHDGDFMDFVMCLIGAVYIQVRGAGPHLRALDDLK